MSATLDLSYWTTPNGHKITIFLEEAELPYTIYPIDIGNAMVRLLRSRPWSCCSVAISQLCLATAMVMCDRAGD